MKRFLPLILIAATLILVGCGDGPPANPTPLPPADPLTYPTPVAVVPTAPSTALPKPRVEPSDSPCPGSVVSRSPAPSAATVTDSPQVPKATAPPRATVDPFDLLSQGSLFAYMEDLVAIRPYSGWRNSASEGEAQALDYVAQRLGQFGYLQDLGLELERQAFHVFLGTELWETRLHLAVNSEQVEVPADGLRGPRDKIARALRFDSDGSLNDSVRDPVVVERDVVLVRTAAQVRDLRRQDVQGKIVFLDYAAVDRIVQGSTQNAAKIAGDLLKLEPAGLVLVTSFSNQVGESHGSFVGDTSALNWVDAQTTPPILSVRLEDLGSAGISDWDGLEQIELARLTWDADVFSPATSGNLIARIPGADGSHAVILGAHIDSPNAPGAMDDGSGSVILLEVARVLNASRTPPPTDLYLVWFGSEELGLYGSSHFAITHQELLDRTVAMLQIDCLTHPLDGIEAEVSLTTWSYGRLGDDRSLWAEYLAEAGGRHGVDTTLQDTHYLFSDNSSFGGFDVPNADLIYVNLEEMEATGSVHYAGHIHDPYDTVALAREVGDALEEMARVALAAALEAPSNLSALRVTARPDRRALFVASHTESIHMAPTALVDLGMALAWEGFDVDTIPYGQAVTANELQGSDLVVVLPVLDYPSPDGDPGLYDVGWSAEEIAALEAYVAEGGFLVLTNSANRLKYGNTVLDPNEDWMDANDLAGSFGISFQNEVLGGEKAWSEGEHPLLEGVASLSLAENNAVAFRLTGGTVLARSLGEPAVALVDHAHGQVLVLADVGILGAEWGTPANLQFWRNLARYARQ